MSLAEAKTFKMKKFRPAMDLIKVHFGSLNYKLILKLKAKMSLGIPMQANLGELGEDQLKEFFVTAMSSDSKADTRLGEKSLVESIPNSGCFCKEKYMRPTKY